MSYKKPKSDSTTALRMWWHRLRATLNTVYRAYTSRPYIRYGFALLILTAVFGVISWQRLDPDFGWHLQSGMYIRAHGIPGHDVFTYTAQSFRWINHEWGNDVLLSLLYGWGGYGLVAGFYGVLWSAGLVIAGAGARVATLLAAAAAIAPYAGVRPLAWTVLFFATVIRLLRGSNQRQRWWLPLLFIIWANLHAGFIAGLGLIVYYFLKERKKSTLLLLIVATLATLCNAYGIRIYEEVLRTILDPALHRQINEWSYLTVIPPSWLFIIVWAAGFWLCDRTNKARWVGTTPLLFLSAMSATRNMPLFVISGVKELDGYVSEVIKAIPKRLDRPRLAVLCVLSLGLLASLVYSYHLVYGPWSTNREATYPSHAVAYLQTHHCEGNLFNTYNYGGYLIWKLPGQLIYIDGRMPTWKPYMDNYEKVMDNPSKNYQAEFKRHNIRCALLGGGDGQRLGKVLHNNHWRTALEADRSVLLLAPNQK